MTNEILYINGETHEIYKKNLLINCTVSCYWRRRKSFNHSV